MVVSHMTRHLLAAEARKIDVFAFSVADSMRDASLVTRREVLMICTLTGPTFIVAALNSRGWLPQTLQFAIKAVGKRTSGPASIMYTKKTNI